MNLREQFLSAWTESYSASADVERYETRKTDECGAGSPGGMGFRRGNTCAGDGPKRGGGRSVATDEQQASRGAGEAAAKRGFNQMTRTMRRGIDKQIEFTFNNEYQQSLYDIHAFSKRQYKGKDSQERVAQHNRQIEKLAKLTGQSTGDIRSLAAAVHADVTSQIKPLEDGQKKRLDDTTTPEKSRLDAVELDIPQERPDIRRKAAPAFANSIQKMLYDHKLKTGEDRKESREEIASHLMTSSDRVDRMSEQVYRDVESQVKSAGDGAAVDLKNNVELLEEMIDAVDPDGTYYGRGGQYEQRKQQETQQQKASEKRQEDVKARRQEPDGDTPPSVDTAKPNYKGLTSNLKRIVDLGFRAGYKGEMPKALTKGTKLNNDLKKVLGLADSSEYIKDSAAAKPIDQMNQDELKIQTKDALRQHLKDVGGKPLSSDTRHVLSQKILDARSGGLKETPLSEMGHAELKTQSRDMLKDELRSLGVKPRSGDTRHGLASKIMEARATQSRQMQMPQAPSPEGGETESSTAPQGDVSNDYDLPDFNIQDAINDYKKQFVELAKSGDPSKSTPELKQLEKKLREAGVEFDIDMQEALVEGGGAKAKFKHEGVSDAIKGWNKAVKDGDDVAAGQLRAALAGVGIDVESAAERHKAKPDRAEVLGKAQDWLDAYRSGDKDAASAIQEEMSEQGYDVKQMVSDAIKKRREAQASTATEEPPAVEPAQEPVEEPVQDAGEDMVEAKEPAAEMPTTDEGIDSDVEDLKVDEPAAEGPFFDSEGLEFDTQEEADANSQAIAEERRIRDEEKAKRPDANWKWDEEGLPVFDKDTDADVDNLKVDDPEPADAPEAPAEAIPQEDPQDQAEDKQVAPEPEEASREAEPQGESIYSDEDKALANKTIKPRSNLDKAIVDQIGDNAYDHKVFKEYVNEAQKMYEQTRDDFNLALREAVGGGGSEKESNKNIRMYQRRAAGSKGVKQREELESVLGDGFDQAVDFLRNYPARRAALASVLGSGFAGESSTGSNEEILHEALKFGLMPPASPDQLVRGAWTMLENEWPHEGPAGEMLMNIEAGIDIKKPAETEGDDPYEIPFSAYLMAEIDKYDSTHIVEIDLTGHEHTPGVQDQLFSDLFTSHWNWSRSFIA